MARIFADDALLATQLPRDWELAHYFSAFVPSGRSLYMQLASRLAIATSRGWNGALVTLNYERLLEVALLRNCLFPVVEGVDFYDDHLPALTPQQCIEITYPHGACHFFLGSKPFTLVNGGGVLMNGRFVGGGVNQLLVQKHISEAIAQQYLPLICRIEPGKRPSVSHEFFDIQRNRTRELILAARLIVIIGVSCRHEVDRHLWQPLAATSARLVYVEPIEAAANKFRSWAKGQGRAEPDGFEVAGFDFANGFDRICSELGI